MPKTNNIFPTNHNLLSLSDSDDSIDQSTLLKNLVQSMNDFALNQSHMLEHKNNPSICFVPVLS